MSIKLYQCYKIPVRLWYQFTCDATEKSMELLAKNTISMTPYVDHNKLYDHYSYLPRGEYHPKMEDPRQSLVMKIMFITDVMENSASQNTAFQLENKPSWIYPVRVEIFAYPIKDSRYIAFGVFRGNLKGLDDWIGKYPGVTDFSYWNNTDKPEDIPNREWNRRGKIWNNLLDNIPLRIALVDFAFDSSRIIVAMQKLLGIGYFSNNGGLERIYQEMYGCAIEEREPYKPPERQ